MNENEIKEICKRYKIKNWSLNQETGLVDVAGSVNLWNKNLTELPLHFGNVSGHFWCYDNKLTTLKGAPISVGGYFSCSDNNLTSLEYCPISVNGFFDFLRNNITKKHKLPNVGNHVWCDKTMKWLF